MESEIRRLRLPVTAIDAHLNRAAQAYATAEAMGPSGSVGTMAAHQRRDAEHFLAEAKHLLGEANLGSR